MAFGRPSWLADHLLTGAGVEIPPVAVQRADSQQVVYGTTSGPLSAFGGVSGSAMTAFQMTVLVMRRREHDLLVLFADEHPVGWSGAGEAVYDSYASLAPENPAQALSQLRVVDLHRDDDWKSLIS